MADFVYTIKAHPTTYTGVEFRSRLEATWAAFFDLAGVSWLYEPIDLDGWTPDFTLKIMGVTLYAEVKPVDTELIGEHGYFSKANVFWDKIQVLRLGHSPVRDLLPSFGSLMDTPSGSDYSWDDLHQCLVLPDARALWVQAQNTTRWKAPRV